MKVMKWFSGMGLFRFDWKAKGRISQYEERVVLVRAKSISDAKRRILSEFAQYAKTSDGEIDFLGRFDVRELFDQVTPGKRPLEISSFMRVSDLTASQFIKRYWEDLRPQSCRQKKWKHVWHNQDGKTSACYNCREIRSGQLWKSKKGGV